MDFNFEEQGNTTFTQREHKTKRKNKLNSSDKRGNLERVLQPKLGEQCFQEGLPPPSQTGCKIKSKLSLKSEEFSIKKIA